jgi:serine/threonine-protein kinase
VKVLDFGLAKAFADEVPESELSASPTLSRDATRAGVILGTAAYMSPEQAKGKAVDKRTDIFSFGIVLYEMLTGKRAFAGEDVSDVLASIIKMEPDWKAVPSDLDPRIQNLLHRCLRKDRKNRLQAIGDVRVEIQEILATAASEQQALAVPALSRARERGAWGLAILVATLLASVAVWSLKPEAPRPLVRVVATPPSAEPLDYALSDVDVAITPDGTRIVYVVVLDGQRHLVVRALDRLETTPLSGPGNAPRGPFIAPDGNWVGYFDGPALQKVSILGGPPVTICDLRGGAPRGASWGLDDTIIFATAGTSGLWRVPAGGGEPEQLTTPDQQGNHWWPEILPGGEAVLFTIIGGPVENAQVAVLSLVTGEIEVLVPGGSNPRYAPTGHIVYGVGGTLRAAGFDLERLDVTSDPIPVLEGVITKGSGAADFGISLDGSLVYIAGDPQGGQKRTLAWVDRDGREEALAAEPRAYTYPRISPDGSRLALDVRDQENDIWIWDFARETLSRLTFGSSNDQYPIWTPDGRRVAFGSVRDGYMNLFWKAADGTGTTERLTESENRQYPHAFSLDGKQLVFREDYPERGFDLGVHSLDGEPSSEWLLATEFNERNAEISPDGRWLAYESDASGQYEIYVRPFPNVDEGRWQISRGGGFRPLWAPDGRELFYLTSTRHLMAVSVRTDPSIAFGTPEVVFEGSYYAPSGPPGRTYDVSPDGHRFLMIKEGSASDETPPAELILVQNWLDELKRLVTTE